MNTRHIFDGPDLGGQLPEPAKVNFADRVVAAAHGWKAKGSQLIVRPLTPANRTASGLLLVPEEHRERPQYGVVLAVGPGMPATATGQIIVPDSRPGDLVAFGKYAGLEFDLDGQRVLLMRESEALCRKPEGSYDLVAHPDPDRPDGPPKALHEVAYQCDMCAEKAQPSGVIAEERERLRRERAEGTGIWQGADKPADPADVARATNEEDNLD